MSSKKGLNAKKIEALKHVGRYCDGEGLWVQVSKWKTKSFVFQYVSPTKTVLRKVNVKKTFKGEIIEQREELRELGMVRQFGLGSCEDVSLSEARDRAAELRKQVKAGKDPIAEREEERRKRRLAIAKQLTFAQCAESYINAHRSEWDNAKHAAQWDATLKHHVYPVLGDIPVARIDTDLVVKVLEPIWEEIPETARRVRGRIEAVLGYGIARKACGPENAARWKHNLDNLLARRKKGKQQKHLAALPFGQMYDYMTTLRRRKDIAARALEFAILTAARTGEVLGARWSEIDLTDRVWTLPAERMKAGKEHRVPLSDQAMDILRGLHHGKPYDYVFGKGDRLSDRAMLDVLQESHRRLTVHGFRATFRTWTEEKTSFPSVVCKLALAHTNKDKVDDAYQRGDLFSKRRQLMKEWANYCEHHPAPKADNVTRLRSRAADASD